ncbi:hypothetical protein [Microcoleus sp. B13-B6]|uniref:hypothetical protein n=1 Tax=Microcoleus sp. B13-B6 TaxID=2818652 RepID=UPI002FCFFCFE
MPVPQEMNFLVEQASCLFHKKLRIVQHLSCKMLSCGRGKGDCTLFYRLFSAGLGAQPLLPTRKSFTICGTGILPVHKRLIDNGARCAIEPKLE